MIASSRVAPFSADRDEPQRGLVALLRTEIENTIERYMRANSDYRTNVPGLHVARIVAPVPPTTHMAEASICICISGARQMTFGGGNYDQIESQYLLSTIGLPSIVAIPDASPQNPYTAVRIELDLELARQIMAEVDVDTGDRQPSQSGISIAPVDHTLLDPVARLVRLIEAPRDVAFLSDLLQREILYRVLTGPRGTNLRQIVRLGSQGHRIAKAASWIRDHFREQFHVEQLATMIGMGVSTLHRHFQDLTGMSPLQYQKHLRLHEARRLMLIEETDVTTTALKVGYESPTQFGREYRRLFGQPPLKNIKSIRSEGGDRTAF
ncbi:MAG TPA: AraC family transcriptional regulator [Kaistia sp.]|nr:AraC family transcriptional regulator [Kaistia sp.]